MRIAERGLRNADCKTEDAQTDRSRPAARGFVIPQSAFRNPQSRRVLFVCTGNTCRSPLAAGVCRAMLAARLGCAEGDLPARGFVIESAGVAAAPGDVASPEAVDVARRYGADLSGHRSQMVTPEMLAAATDVLAMTHGHGMLLALRYPDAGARVRLLGGPGGDVPDPIGGGRDVYELCAAVIAGHLDGHLAEWVGP